MNLDLPCCYCNVICYHQLHRFTAIHRSSPMASWDNECALQNLRRSSIRVLFFVFFLIWIWTSYSFHTPIFTHSSSIGLGSRHIWMQHLCPAEFCSTPYQIHPNQLNNVLRITWKITGSCVEAGWKYNVPHIGSPWAGLKTFDLILRLWIFSFLFNCEAKSWASVTTLWSN